MTTFQISRRHALSVCLVAAWPSARAGAYEDFLRAVEVDDADALQTLLARGMDPNTRNAQGHPALYLALRGDAKRVAALLIQHPGLEVDAPNSAGETPLMMAALRGDLVAMQALIKRGAQTRREGWTPLHYAASGPSTDAVRLLLAGSDVNARAPNGNTAIMLAARWGPESSVDLLLQQGANPATRNQRGHNAADYARLDGRESLANRLDSTAR